MIGVVVLLVLEVLLAAYIATRVLRYQVAPTPVLRAAILTAASLLVAMFSVTEPIEVLLRGPDAIAVGVPTLLKHLGLLGCGVGVLLMTLGHRQVQRVSAELAVWAWFAVSSTAVIVLHGVAGGGATETSVEFVHWSHSQPMLVAAMLIAYVGGFAACIGMLAMIWPLHLRSAAGRGLAILAIGALLSAGWCVMRVLYVLNAVTSTDDPTGEDFLVTKLLSLTGMLLLTVGLIWSTAEADAAALRHWWRFRRLSARVLEVVPAVRRESDLRHGVDSWVADRAVEVLDGLHQIERSVDSGSGFPHPPAAVSDVELTAVVAKLGARYRDGGAA